MANSGSFIDLGLFTSYFDELEKLSFQPFEERWKVNFEWLSSQASLAKESPAPPLSSLRHHIEALSIPDLESQKTSGYHKSATHTTAATSFSLFSTEIPLCTTPLDLPTFIPMTTALFGRLDSESVLPYGSGAPAVKAPPRKKAVASTPRRASLRRAPQTEAKKPSQQASECENLLTPATRRRSSRLASKMNPSDLPADCVISSAESESEIEAATPRRASRAGRRNSTIKVQQSSDSEQSSEDARKPTATPKNSRKKASVPEVETTAETPSRRRSARLMKSNSESKLSAAFREEQAEIAENLEKIPSRGLPSFNPRKTRNLNFLGEPEPVAETLPTEKVLPEATPARRSTRLLRSQSQTTISVSEIETPRSVRKARTAKSKTGEESDNSDIGRQSSTESDPVRRSSARNAHPEPKLADSGSEVELVTPRRSTRIRKVLVEDEATSKKIEEVKESITQQSTEETAHHSEVAEDSQPDVPSPTENKSKSQPTRATRQRKPLVMVAPELVPEKIQSVVPVGTKKSRKSTKKQQAKAVEPAENSAPCLEDNQELAPKMASASSSPGLVKREKQTDVALKAIKERAALLAHEAAQWVASKLEAASSQFVMDEPAAIVFSETACSTDVSLMDCPPQPDFLAESEMEETPYAPFAPQPLLPMLEESFVAQDVAQTTDDIMLAQSASMSSTNEALVSDEAELQSFSSSEISVHDLVSACEVPLPIKADSPQKVESSASSPHPTISRVAFDTTMETGNQSGPKTGTTKKIFGNIRRLTPKERVLKMRTARKAPVHAVIEDSSRDQALNTDELSLSQSGNPVLPDDENETPATTKVDDDHLCSGSQINLSDHVDHYNADQDKLNDLRTEPVEKIDLVGSFDAIDEQTSEDQVLCTLDHDPIVEQHLSACQVEDISLETPSFAVAAESASHLVAEASAEFVTHTIEQPQALVEEVEHEESLEQLDVAVSNSVSLMTDQGDKEADMSLTICLPVDLPVSNPVKEPPVAEFSSVEASKIVDLSVVVESSFAPELMKNPTLDFESSLLCPAPVFSPKAKEASAVVPFTESPAPPIVPSVGGRVREILLAAEHLLQESADLVSPSRPSIKTGAVASAQLTPLKESVHTPSKRVAEVVPERVVEAVLERAVPPIVYDSDSLFSIPKVTPMKSPMQILSDYNPPIGRMTPSHVDTSLGLKSPEILKSLPKPHTMMTSESPHPTAPPANNFNDSFFKSKALPPMVLFPFTPYQTTASPAKVPTNPVLTGDDVEEISYIPPPPVLPSIFALDDLIPAAMSPSNEVACDEVPVNETADDQPSKAVGSEASAVKKEDISKSATKSNPLKAEVKPASSQPAGKVELKSSQTASRSKPQEIEPMSLLAGSAPTATKKSKPGATTASVGHKPKVPVPAGSRTSTKTRESAHHPMAKDEKSQNGTSSQQHLQPLTIPVHRAKLLQSYLVPDWAKGESLMQALLQQESVDPSQIFDNDWDPTIDLVEIFGAETTTVTTPTVAAPASSQPNGNTQAKPAGVPSVAAASKRPISNAAGRFAGGAVRPAPPTSSTSGSSSETARPSGSSGLRLAPRRPPTNTNMPLVRGTQPENKVGNTAPVAVKKETSRPLSRWLGLPSQSTKRTSSVAK